jgi:hypothetical protein
MESNHFDKLSKTLANRSSRRTAIRRAGVGGFAAALLGSAGTRRGAAQEATPTTGAGHICIASFEATVRQGPDAETSYAGTLALGIGPSGAIDEGVLVTDDGASIAVVGQANGHAINLLFTIADGQYLFGVGTAAGDLAECNGVLDGTMGGPFVGPQAADGGDWIIQLIPPAGFDADECTKCVQDSCPSIGRPNCAKQYGAGPCKM